MAQKCARLGERHIAESTLEGLDVDMALIVHYQARALHKGAVASLPLAIHMLALEINVLPAIWPAEALAAVNSSGKNLLVGRARYTFEASVGRSARNR